jgi:hypothetical protein
VSIRPSRRAAPAIAGLALVVLISLSAAPAAARAPGSFFGIQAWSDPGAPDFVRMSQAGIRTYRANLLWSIVEYRKGARNWQPYDQLVTSAASARIGLLPVLLGSPRFAAKRYQYPPRTRKALRSYTAFVRDAARRYGRKGSFWRAHPELPYKPISAWQAWNEPNFPAYWYKRPSARQYVRFLRLTRKTLKRVDKRAKVVLAGIPDTRVKRSIRMVPFLQRIYRARGRRAFDVMAVHPYAKKPRDVITAVKKARAVMRRYHDSRKSVWVTEIGWATGGRVSKHTRAFKTSKKGQASRLGKTYRLLLRARRRYRIGMGVWFTWQDRRRFRGERDWWAIHTGLFDQIGRPKPAWRQYARVAGGNPGTGALGESTPIVPGVTPPPTPTPKPGCPLIVICP